MLFSFFLFLAHNYTVGTVIIACIPSKWHLYILLEKNPPWWVVDRCFSSGFLQTGILGARFLLGCLCGKIKVFILSLSHINTIKKVAKPKIDNNHYSVNYTVFIKRLINNSVYVLKIYETSI